MERNDEWLKQKCNRYVNGKCSTLACLQRGGYISGGPDYRHATCEPHEILQELESLRAAQPPIAVNEIVEIAQ